MEFGVIVSACAGQRERGIARGAFAHPAQALVDGVADGGGVAGIGLDEPGLPDPAASATAAVADAATSAPAGRGPALPQNAPPLLPLAAPAPAGLPVPVRASGPQAPMPANGP